MGPSTIHTSRSGLSDTQRATPSLNCKDLVHTLLQVVHHRVESFAGQRIPRDTRLRGAELGA